MSLSTTTPSTDVPTDQPVIDEDGLLRFDDRWIDLPEAQIPVVELFLAQPGRLVDLEVIRDAYVEHGGTSNPSALRKVIGRIRLRLARVGLRLHVVRGSGAILEVPEPALIAAYTSPVRSLVR